MFLHSSVGQPTGSVMSQTFGEHYGYENGLAAPSRLVSALVVFATAATVVGLAWSTLVFVLGCIGLFVTLMLFNRGPKPRPIIEAEEQELPLVEQIKLDLIYPMAFIAVLMLAVLALATVVL